MVYGLINEVRTLAGIKPVHAHNLHIADANGSTTEFKIPNIGNNQGFFVDINATKTSTITVDDIVVKVDGVPVTVSSLDEVEGTVILAVAPDADAEVSIDYKWSEVSDANVIKAMDVAEEIVDGIIRSKAVGSNAYTQIISGDGSTFEWEFDHDLVTSVGDVTLNGTVLTESTEYVLWKFKRTSHYWYIEFKAPPNSGHQNLTIAYTYGEASDLADQLSNLYSARHLINRGEVRGGNSEGTWEVGDGEPDQSGDKSRLGMIAREILHLMQFVDSRTKYDTI